MNFAKDKQDKGLFEESHSKPKKMEIVESVNSLGLPTIKVCFSKRNG